MSKHKYYFMSLDAHLKSHMAGFPSDEEYRKGSQIKNQKHDLQSYSSSYWPLYEMCANLAAQQIPQITLQRLAQITVHPWTKENQPERIVLRCIFKTDTEEQIRLNLKWENDYRYRDLKGLQGTMICTYPVKIIIPTISGSYRK